MSAIRIWPVVPDLTPQLLAEVDFSAGVTIDSVVFPNGTNLELVTPRGLPTEMPTGLRTCGSSSGGG